MKTTHLLLGRRALLALALALAASGASAWPTPTQKTTANRVTVSITAGSLDPAASIWDFAVSFHSEGPALDDEMMEAPRLVSESRITMPLAWEGEGPTRGHHRTGVLKFIAVHPQPKWLELHLQRKGERQPRVYRWEFGDWQAAVPLR